VLDSIVKKASLISLSRIINLTGLLIVTIILARHFSKSEFALYDQIWLILNTITPIISFAFSSAVYFFGVKEKSNNYITTIFSFLTLLGFALTILLYLLRFEIGKILNNALFPENFFYFALFFLFSVPTLILDSLFILRNEFKKLFLVTLITVMLYIIAVLFSTFFSKGILFIFACLSAIAILRFIYMIGFLRKNFNLNLTNSRLKEVLTYTSPLIFGHISAILSRQIDKFIIASNFAPEIYAIYGVGAKELPVVPLITSSFASVSFPEISKLYDAGKKTDVAKLISDVIKSTAVFVLPVFSYLLFFSNEFVVVLFSPKYAESAEIFRIYIFFLPVRILLYSPILSALGRQKIYMFISLIDLALNFILGLSLLKVIGLKGPAVAVVLSTYIETSLMLYFILRTLSGIKLWDIFPVKFLILVLAISLSIASFCYLIGKFIYDVNLRFLATGLLFSVVYFALIKRRIIPLG
jgi:O-antigen/teichoic acid export membrane protein